MKNEINSKNLAAAFLFGLCALLPVAAQAQINVVTTTSDLAAIARAIGGNYVRVTSLGRPQEDPHFVQPRPSHIVALNRADVLVEMGLEMEAGYLPALLDQVRNPRIRPGSPGRVVASDGVALLEIPAAPVTRAMGDIHASGNPHFLADPERGKVAARNIAQALTRVDPSHADEYAANLAKLENRINDRIAECRRLLTPFHGLKVVTYHRSLTYFEERFGLQTVNTIEPKPGIPPSPAHLASLIGQMNAKGVKVILQEPWHETRTARLLERKTGARLVVLPIQAGDAVEDYADVCVAIVRKILDALK